MAFGLKIRKTPKDVIDKKIKEAAKVLGLTEYLKQAGDMSGGQRQRVAWEAIVRDANLLDGRPCQTWTPARVSMRAEIAKIHHQLKTTTIYVTHDQVEAMTWQTDCHHEGRKIQQVGTPQEATDTQSMSLSAALLVHQR